MIQNFFLGGKRGGGFVILMEHTDEVYERLSRGGFSLINPLKLAWQKEAVLMQYEHAIDYEIT